jgi:hypothetical protein
MRPGYFEVVIIGHPASDKRAARSSQMLRIPRDEYKKFPTINAPLRSSECEFLIIGMALADIFRNDARTI